ncbi:MAG TPA: metallophosphoesterase, partial [Erysipelotrichaceae bacterium]|nr:metallophosphoesterase [Erysipelotrichaceae bacterium]
MKKIIISIIIGLVLSACSSTHPKIETGSDIKLYVATDIHLLAEELMTNDDLMAQVFEFGDGRFVHYTNELMSTFTNTIKENQPDILILSGDLTHDGEKLSHEALAKQLKEIEKNGTRVFVVPGNHDLENAFAKDYAIGGWKTAETVSADEFESIYKNYGYDEAISRDPSGLSYLAAPSEDVYLLMLDSNKYGILNMPTGSGKFTDETLSWIKEATQIARDNNAQIITVMHHNLIKHSERLYEGYVINNSDEVVPIFDELNLNIVLSGHMHAQDIKYT